METEKAHVDASKWDFRNQTDDVTLAASIFYTACHAHIEMPQWVTGPRVGMCREHAASWEQDTVDLCDFRERTKETQQAEMKLMILKKIFFVWLKGWNREKQMLLQIYCRC